LHRAGGTKYTIPGYKVQSLHRASAFSESPVFLVAAASWRPAGAGGARAGQTTRAQLRTRRKLPRERLCVPARLLTARQAPRGAAPNRAPRGALYGAALQQTSCAALQIASPAWMRSQGVAHSCRALAGQRGGQARHATPWQITLDPSPGQGAQQLCTAPRGRASSQQASRAGGRRLRAARGSAAPGWSCLGGGAGRARGPVRATGPGAGTQREGLAPRPRRHHSGTKYKRYKLYKTYFVPHEGVFCAQGLLNLAIGNNLQS
jgi:hypothetical protein